MDGCGTDGVVASDANPGGVPFRMNAATNEVLSVSLASFCRSCGSRRPSMSLLCDSYG